MRISDWSSDVCSSDLRRAAKAAAFQFAFAQPQVLRQRKPLRNVGQRRLLDETGPHPRQIALVDFSKSLEQQRGHDEIQNRIAQEFKTLVVTHAMAAMSKSLFVQGRIAKLVAQSLFLGSVTDHQ